MLSWHYAGILARFIRSSCEGNKGEDIRDSQELETAGAHNGAGVFLELWKVSAWGWQDKDRRTNIGGQRRGPAQPGQLVKLPGTIDNGSQTSVLNCGTLNQKPSPS